MYWRAGPIAAHVGVAPRTFVDDCLSGRVPVRVECFGERQLPYVHSGDVLAYLDSIGKGLAA